jgi:hypothetical protein
LKNINATYKGLVTGVLMIVISLVIYQFKGSFENNLQYITYTVYVLGIVWAIYALDQSQPETRSFKIFFTEGFKCFIVVTFLMVSFTLIFITLNPALKEQMALETRRALSEKENYTPAEIDKMVQQSKDYFLPLLTSMAIFGYLAIGAVVSAITALYFSNKSKVQNG